MVAMATLILLTLPEQLAPDPHNNDRGRAAGQPAGADLSTTIEGVDMIDDKYSKLSDICSLHAVQVLLLCLVTMQVRSARRRTFVAPTPSSSQSTSTISSVGTFSHLICMERLFFPSPILAERLVDTADSVDSQNQSFR